MNSLDARRSAIKKLNRDCKHSFAILHNGWETDNVGWIMADGCVFTTACGDVYEMCAEEIEAKISEAELSLANLNVALAATKNGGTR